MAEVAVAVDAMQEVAPARSVESAGVVERGRGSEPHGSSLVRATCDVMVLAGLEVVARQDLMVRVHLWEGEVAQHMIGEAPVWGWRVSASHAE